MNRDVDRYAQLLAAGMDEAPAQSPDELAAILRHELSSPMEIELGGLDVKAGVAVSVAADVKGLVLKSLDDLLSHPQPPVELLRMAKEYAKAHLNSPKSPLPPEVVRVIYFSSIIVATTRCDEPISHLNTEALVNGARWALSQPWLDEQTRSILLEGIAFLTQPSQG